MATFKKVYRDMHNYKTEDLSLISRLSPALVIPSAQTILASSRRERKVKVVRAEGITREEHVRRKGKGVLKVPLGEEHQQEVHTPNMFFPGDTFSTDHLYLSSCAGRCQDGPC